MKKLAIYSLIATFVAPVGLAPRRAEALVGLGTGNVPAIVAGIVLLVAGGSVAAPVCYSRQRRVVPPPRGCRRCGARSRVVLVRRSCARGESFARAQVGGTLALVGLVLLDNESQSYFGAAPIAESDRELAMEAYGLTGDEIDAYNSDVERITNAAEDVEAMSEGRTEEEIRVIAARELRAQVRSNDAYTAALKLISGQVEIK